MKKKVNTLEKIAFYKPTLPRDEVAKVLGISFDDLKNRPQQIENNQININYINLNDIFNEKIREKIVKLYKKDQVLKTKSRLKVLEEINSNCEAFPIVDESWLGG
jgi:hypothetical protein